MRTLLIAAALAAAAAATPAAADHHRAECVFETSERDGTHRGAAYGFIVGDPGDDVSISCAVEVFGDPVAATPPSSGTGVAVTYAPLEFTPDNPDGLKYCTVTTVNGAASRDCYWSDPVQVPPQEVIDLLIPVAEEVDRALLPVWDLLGPREPDDAPMCPLFQSVAGTYGPVVVNTQGDVFLAGEPFWDCPPYDLFPP